MEFENSQGNILKLKVSGTLNENDIKKAGQKMKLLLEDHKQLKLYLEIGDHEEEDEGPFFEKLRNELQGFSNFEKIAVISPQSWIERYSEMLTGLDSTDSKVFEPTEVKKAKEWISSSPKHKSDTKPHRGRLPKRDVPDVGQSQKENG